MNTDIKATRKKVDVRIILSTLWAARMLSIKGIGFGNLRNTSNQYDAISIVNNIVDPNLYEFPVPDIEG